MSAIQIKVVSVENSTVPTAKGSYGVAEVTYKNLTFENKIEAKKVMSFTHKEVYNTLKSAEMGAVFTVQRVKNDKGYWDWVSLGDAPVETTGGTSVATAAKATASPKSTYETPEERAKKQVYIVRQSSITAAIAVLKTDKKNPTPDEVMQVADMFVHYVMNDAPNPVTDVPTQDLEDDIPY